MKEFMRRIASTILHPSASAMNIATYSFAVFMSIASFVFLNALQPAILEEIVKYPRNLHGTATAWLTIADELTALAFFALWGFSSDLLNSRRIPYSLGFLFLSLGLFLYPQAKEAFPSNFSAFFTSLLFFRMIFAVGASAATAMLSAVHADYSAQRGRGKMAAFVGVVSGLGAIFAAFVFVRIAVWAGIATAYHVVGGLVAGASFLLFIGLSRKVAAKDEDIEQVTEPSTTSLMSMLKNPLILLCFLCSFVARSDSVATTIFIPLLVKSHFTENPALCSSMPACPEAKRLSSSQLGTVNTSALVLAPLFGFLCDKYSPSLSLLIANVCGMAAYLAFSLLPLTHWTFYLASCMAGAAQIGLIVSSLALLSSLAPIRSRGSLSGISSIFGAIGILAVSLLGGLLFDQWKTTAPFILLFIFNSVAAIHSLICCFIK